MLAIFMFFAIGLIDGKSLSNNDAVSIYKYAKVSKWGPNNNNNTSTGVQQGRSHSGHAHWPHSSDGNFVQTHHSKTNVVKQFPVYIKPASRLDSMKVEQVPGIGEVIQDRFNVRPAFSYTQIPPSNEDSATYGPPKSSTPPAVPAAFPAVFNVAPAAASAKPPVDLYTSPYSSYNPPKKESDSSENSYPPSIDSYAAPPPDGDGPYSPTKMSSRAASATLGPPLSPDFENDHHSYAAPHLPESEPPAGPPPSPDEHDHYSYAAPHPPSPPEFDHSHHEEVDAYPSDHVGNHHMPKSSGDMFPDKPPKSIDDVYYPPDFPEDQKQQKVAPDMAADMTADLNPPVDPTAFDHSFPKYLYDNPHYDHHVYEEIQHPTTTEATEKRVSSTNYSYYYLGRKLWYIPLYFSIYFMIYVTALILKAIARHKVQLRDEWSTSHSRSARQLNFDPISTSETVDHLHRNITAALDSANKLYNAM